MTLFDRTTKLRVRRLFRRRQRQVEAVTVAAEEQFETNLIKRFSRLLLVKRFIFGWIGLIVLITACAAFQTLALSGYYQQIKPVPGGIYTDGMVGVYSNASPIYATGSVDTAVSRLIFAGLLKYDEHNGLTGDLASSYSVDQTGRHYTVTLRSGLVWQDGKPLTAKDVVFTYHLIQNPDAHSPFLSSWQGITISAPSNDTVKFDLPSPLSSFPYSLVAGIVPEHLLGSIPAGQIRSSNFNTIRPVGAGPFAWQALQTSGSNDPTKATTFIALKPFKAYAGGTPKLDGFVVRAYATDAQMLSAFKNREITAMAGLGSVPASLNTSKANTIYNFPSTAALMTFFKTSSGVLSDVQVRQALIRGADTDRILENLGYFAKPVREPLLSGQLGYDAKYQQAAYNPAAAEDLLNKAGWIQGSNGLRSKGGTPLSFRLYAEDTSENRVITAQLTKDWRAIGIDAIPVLQVQSDLQTTLEFHTYDALLNGISIGADPDVFAYWDSSQTDIRSSSRLNFSEYKSSLADAALEAGRTRTDSALRTIKYKPFLQAWQADAPALGLYQPRILYITKGTVYGLNERTLNTDSDRYSNVADWQIHTARVTN